MTTTNKEFERRNKNLERLGINPIYKTLSEKRKAVIQMNKNARDLGYAKGIDQAVEELKEIEQQNNNKIKKCKEVKK